MKKTLGMALAVLMASSLTVAAYAGEDAGSTADNPVEFSYEDIDTSVYDGAWFDTGLGFDVYLPEDWEESELTDEMTQAGVAFVAGEDEETGGANMIITCSELPDVAAGYTLEQLGQELAAANTTALFADLNGIPAVIFENDETGISGYAFLTENGYIVAGVISPSPEIGYEDYGPYFQNMIMSVSPSEEDAEETTAEKAE